MHVALDLNWFVQLLLLALAAAFAFHYLLRNTASRYFALDSNFASTAPDFASDRNGRTEIMAAAGGEEVSDACAVCGMTTTKQCARCKMVKYCSEACQRTHWNSEHKTKCKQLQSLNKANHTKLLSVSNDRKTSLVLSSGSPKTFKKSNTILFPYEEFVKFFDWEKPEYPPPCGLLNCGNSCFANVVLQCLAYTRPLVAYMLEKSHKTECQMEKWCFFCEFQKHVERATRSSNPFSPMNILSRLPHIGGNLGYGQQEDAHEFMRVAIDSMQSACLDEFGGEKAVHPNYQQTTLIQHIFGGRLQSQVICTECNNVSSQFENMMDLTVEIHGDAGTLEECLDQFTAKEQLHGDNKYKCDGCNAYVTAWKRLSIQQAPNILTIALKRFQSGRFGKLNKRVTFPERLSLGSYMSELEAGNEYILYAVIVHVDMLNASFFGHYINYVKDFRGNWYRIDDCEVARADIDEVLSQEAYMLLYKRIHARPSCLLLDESLKEQKENTKTQAMDPSAKEPTESSSALVSGAFDNHVSNCLEASANIQDSSITFPEEPGSPLMNGEIHSIEIVQNTTNSSDDIVEPIPVSTSSIDNRSMKLDANDAAPSISKTRVTVQESTSAENGNIEEDKVLSNVSPSNGNSNGEASSGTKLKPVFTPGFLGKQDLKQKSKVPFEAKKWSQKIQKNTAAQDGERNPSLVLHNGTTDKSLKNGDSEASTSNHCMYLNSNNKRNDAGNSRAAKPCC